MNYEIIGWFGLIIFIAFAFRAILAMYRLANWSHEESTTYNKNGELLQREFTFMDGTKHILFGNMHCEELYALVRNHGRITNTKHLNGFSDWGMYRPDFYRWAGKTTLIIAVVLALGVVFRT